MPSATSWRTFRIHLPRIEKSKRIHLQITDRSEFFVEREDHLGELSRQLGVSIETSKRLPSICPRSQALRSRRSNPDKNSEIKGSVQLTTAEDDLLFVLLHDNRVASPLAHIFDPSWLDLKVPSGRVLAKILPKPKLTDPWNQIESKNSWRTKMNAQLTRITSIKTLTRQTKKLSPNLPINASTRFFFGLTSIANA